MAGSGLIQELEDYNEIKGAREGANEVVEAFNESICILHSHYSTQFTNVLLPIVSRIPKSAIKPIKLSGYLVIG